jgi:hypothetical protein
VQKPITRSTPALDLQQEQLLVVRHALHRVKVTGSGGGIAQFFGRLVGSWRPMTARLPRQYAVLPVLREYRLSQSADLLSGAPSGHHGCHD